MLVFFFIGLYLSLALFNQPNPAHYPVPLAVFYIFLIIFFSLGFLTFIFLAALSRNKLSLDEEKLKLINTKNSSEINWGEINKIKIKRRTNGVIREIYLWSKHNKPLFISAFENDFASIEKIIKANVNQDVIIKEITEPLNFDHFLFYPLFGLGVGILSYKILDLVFNLKSGASNIISSIFGLYLLVLGMYFLIKKPIHSRSSKKQATLDYLFGLFLIIFSVLIMML